ncbi:MAG TPA: RES family NAD+ phosphorylase [Bryobacteraceae bacterium]|jgi:RES domain-containing protein|nr:RES family NAD+ phosphorylase [Bryobacteraceae bacterium]
MSQRVYRVCRAIHARLDGEGARRVGGRWNSPGHAVVYMAESISLAVLENLVHMSKQDFPVGYVSVSAFIPDGLSILTEDDVGMHLLHAGPKELGDHWIDSLASAVLRVRSAVVPDEFNFLLNPTHPEFEQIIAEPAIPFAFDERLFGSS